MKKTVIQYRNKNDFRFGSFYVITGFNWVEIHGRLKKQDSDSIFIKIVWILKKCKM